MWDISEILTGCLYASHKIVPRFARNRIPAFDPSLHHSCIDSSPYSVNVWIAGRDSLTHTFEFRSELCIFRRDPRCNALEHAAQIELVPTFIIATMPVCGDARKRSWTEHQLCRLSLAAHATNHNPMETESFTTNVFSQEAALITSEIRKIVVVASQPGLAMSEKIDEAQAPRLAKCCR